MTSHEFEALVQRYLRNECTGEEKEMVEEWFAGMTRDEGTGLDADQKAILRNKLWNKVNASATEYEPKLRTLNYKRIAAVAASVSAIAILSFAYFNYKRGAGNDIRVDQRQSVAFLIKVVADKSAQQIDLNDGSSVILEPGSELSYPETFGSTREVRLKGEAFFNVARDEKHPFEVHSDEVTTHVLGTSFRVKAYENSRQIVVSVRSGKVSVSANNSGNQKTNVKEAILLPNQQVVFQRNTGNLEKAFVTRPVIVKADTVMNMTFNDDPVTEVFEALSHLYGVEIKFNKETLSSCTVTTNLMEEEGLFERLEMVCHAVNAKYSVVDTVIVIEGNGCN